MPAVIRRVRPYDGKIRLGPDCFVWGDPYTRSLDLEIRRVNVGVIGGLVGTLSRPEYRWLEDAFIREGLRPAMERCKPGHPTRLVMMAMPRLRRA